MSRPRPVDVAANATAQVAVGKVRDLVDALDAAFVERAVESRLLALALLSGEHVLLLGDPGTGKSAITTAFTGALTGARGFAYLLGKYSVPEELFGPLDLAALKAGRYRRVTAGRLPEADVAFLDEIFKANSAVLNALLTALNERAFDDDGQRKQIPLRLCVGASNEMPEDDAGLDALFDRFLFRRWVSAIKDRDALRGLLAGSGAPAVAVRLDWSDVEAARAAAFPLRRQGGVYFVPTATLGIVERLKAAVDTIGDCKIRIGRIGDDAGSRADVGFAAKESLTDGLAELRATVAAWRESARSVRADSSEGALAAFAELKARADLYADALGLALGEFTAEIDAAKADAVALIGSLATAPKEPRQPRTPRDPNAPGPSAKHAPAIRALFEAHAIDSVATIGVEQIRGAGLPESATKYTTWWNTYLPSCAAAGVAAAGLVAVAKQSNGTLVVKLTERVTATTAQPEQQPSTVETTTEPPSTETVVAPDPDAVADRREELTHKTRSELEHSYRRAVGHTPASTMKKPAMIADILAAEAARASAAK